MCGSMVDIQSAAAEIRRGIKKEKEDRKKLQGKNIMSASATQGGHITRQRMVVSTSNLVETFTARCASRDALSRSVGQLDRK